MKKSIFLISCLFIVLGCSKESSIVELDQEVNLRAPGSKVDVCHSTGQGNWSIININENALAGHLAHGDVQIMDNDGDGWAVEPSECMPGGDCNDDDPLIFPGNGCDGDSACPCFSLSEVSSAPNELYYDDRINDCAGEGIGFIQIGGERYGVLPTSQVGVSPDGSVHFGLSLEETNACIGIIEQVQANLNLPNFCTSPFTGNGQTGPFISID